jgi:hypothetical protein
MTFAPTRSFVQEARLNGITYIYNGHAIELSASNARSTMYSATLAIDSDGESVGYLTEWSDREMGAIAPHLFRIAAPSLHSDLDSALSKLGL